MHQPVRGARSCRPKPTLQGDSAPTTFVCGPAQEESPMTVPDALSSSWKQALACSLALAACGGPGEGVGVAAGESGLASAAKNSGAQCWNPDIGTGLRFFDDDTKSIIVPFTFPF